MKPLKWVVRQLERDSFDIQSRSFTTAAILPLKFWISNWTLHSSLTLSERNIFDSSPRSCPLMANTSRNPTQEKKKPAAELSGNCFLFQSVKKRDCVFNNQSPSVIWTCLLYKVSVKIDGEQRFQKNCHFFCTILPSAVIVCAVNMTLWNGVFFSCGVSSVELIWLSSAKPSRPIRDGTTWRNLSNILLRPPPANCVISTPTVKLMRWWCCLSFSQAHYDYNFSFLKPTIQVVVMIGLNYFFLILKCHEEKCFLTNLLPMLLKWNVFFLE